ncbi:MAG: hypothetical protein R2710_05285 [Acidimicrobiales bacterium]
MTSSTGSTTPSTGMRVTPKEADALFAMDEHAWIEMPIWDIAIGDPPEAAKPNVTGNVGSTI